MPKKAKGKSRCYCNYTGVYLSLNGDPIPNHGYVVISDTGFTVTDNTALICHTNRPFKGYSSGGDWIAPDGTKVLRYHYYDGVPGFTIYRSPMMVSLIRSTGSGSPSEGIYVCGVEDDTFTYQTIYVGLYNNGGGIHKLCVLYYGVYRALHMFYYN